MIDKSKFMRLNNMNKLSKVLNYFVFIFTTIAIAGVFYEGMSLEWFDIVGIFIIAMDVSFLISTVINLFVYRRTKWIYICNIIHNIPLICFWLINYNKIFVCYNRL